MSASPLPAAKTEALYQKDGQLYTHTSTLTSLSPLSGLPTEMQSLFKPPPETTPYILTMPSTIFHAQGGGQPSDTGTITHTPDPEHGPATTFHVHQVRKVDPCILHMGTFSSNTTTIVPSLPTGTTLKQEIDVAKRTLHSRIHTAGHVIGLAINLLSKDPTSGIPPSILDGKASHYPGAAFVESFGLIPGSAKDTIQTKVNELVAQDLPVAILFWSEERARSECLGVSAETEVKGDEEDGVRVVRIGEVGSYPCGGTHVLTLRECGEIVVRGIKRQKGISKVSYEVR